MRTVQYKITAPGHNNYMTVTYENGKLQAIEGIHLMAKLWEDVAINEPIPIEEELIPAKMEQYAGMVGMEKIMLSSTGEKIALFCRIYQEELGVKYAASRVDASKISKLKIDEDLLRLYFKNEEWWGKQPKSIVNLANNYNALLQLQAAGTKPAKQKAEFPDYWTQSYQDRLPTNRHSAYWKHLRNLGLEPVRNGMGKVVEWAKKVSGIFILTGLFLALLLVSGCMTPQRAARVTAKHPEFFPTKVDTFYKPILFYFNDTITVPGDTSSWSWAIDADIDTIKVLDTTLLGENERLKAQLRLQKNSNKNLWLELKTETKPDTIIIEKTIELPCPQVEKKTTITVRQHWWMPWAIAVLTVLLITSLWRGKR